MNLVWFVPLLLESSRHSLRFILFYLDIADLKFTVINDHLIDQINVQAVKFQCKIVLMLPVMKFFKIPL